MTICIDVAGAATGGAARYRSELMAYMQSQRPTGVTVIGTQQDVTPNWLMRRELLAGSAGRIATNNVSFIGGQSRVVLLRNALHFLRPRELESPLDRRVSLQGVVVRQAVRRADLVVVPTSNMAQRVADRISGIHSRITIRPHPLTLKIADTRPTGIPQVPFILMSAIPAAHKATDRHIRELTAALRIADRPELVVVTAPADSLSADILEDGRVIAVGVQPHWWMPIWYQACRAVYFPTAVESFGYPLAEARVIGRPVLALDTPQNREVAGPALCGFNRTPNSLRDAVDLAGSKDLQPEPEAFSALKYFRWLLSTAQG